MAKRRSRIVKYRFSGTEEGRATFTSREYAIARRWVSARGRVLLKAGYRRDEISFRDNSGMEVGLISLSVKRLRKLELLKGRRKHVKDLMKDFRLTRPQAQDQAVKDFEKWGGVKGYAADYIVYYYHRG